MLKYKKFEFPELCSGDIVTQQCNDGAGSNESAQKDALVHKTIIKHLTNIIEPGSQEDAGCGILAQKAEDIDHIKEVSYQQGYEDAKSHLQPMIEEKMKECNFNELLQSKLSDISATRHSEKELVKLCSEIMCSIVQKLALILPTDFDKRFLSEIVGIIKKFYKEGKITIKVHSTKVDYCKNLLQLQKLPKRIINNCEVVECSSLKDSDCQVDWNESRFDYSTEQILVEIEKILAKLKQYT